ncbi:hypothetical protein [Vibrio navarrensis]|uniref:hypothetical protein n=1 Tax=Vibrio navarrensis TaxID=29495 RepID=UPI00186A04FB|nr:hypothetical protein [Vibrio navarrensis]MBE4621254.1 hypothetical protein [Vibrio navarrensis]
MFDSVTLKFKNENIYKNHRVGINWIILGVGLLFLKQVNYTESLNYLDYLLIVASITLGLISVFYSWLYMMYLKSKGFTCVDVIYCIPDGKCEFNEVTPFHFSKHYKTFYIWKSVCGIKYMKHFHEISELVEHFQSKPNQELNLGHIYNAEKLLISTGINYEKAFFPMPIKEWVDKMGVDY